MEKLIFTCDNDKKKDADFYITYNTELRNWNDFGYYIQYRIYATPRITPNKKEVCLGGISILDKYQKMSERDWLENTLKEKGTFSLFHELPSSFSSSVGQKTATMLWMLLDCSQRKNFIDAMHLILDDEGPYWDNIRYNSLNPIFRNGIKRAKKDYLDLVREIMLSPTDFRLTKECYHQLFEK